MKMNELLYYNGYGGFSADGRSYIIKIEGETTPVSWSHMIANKRFGCIATTNGIGCTWCDNSRDNRITTWNNDSIIDKPSEVIYIGTVDDVFSLTPIDFLKEIEYTIEFGFGFAKYQMERENISFCTTVFVPQDETKKINVIKMKNNTNMPKQFSMYYALDMVLGVSKEYTKKHLVLEKNGDVIIAQNKYNEKYGDRKTFLTCTEKISEYSFNKSEVFKNDDFKKIEVKNKVLSSDNKLYSEPCIIVKIDMQLDANEEKEIAFILGQEEEAKNQIDNIAKIYEKLRDTKEYWENLLDTMVVSTPVDSMNIIMNGWLIYQTLVSRLFARTSIYQPGGAFGFRDQLQDTLALMYVEPKIAKEQILYHSKHQFEEGDVLHWWHPERDNGIRTKYSDDLLWMAYIVSEYVEITGDYGILDIETEYIKAPLLKEEEEERYGDVQISDKKDTLYNHCIKAIDISLKFGQNGLPQIGGGDWNDGMNKIQGESVWLGFFIYTILKKFIKICESRSDIVHQKKYNEILIMLRENLNNNAWDGRWYKRAFFKDGTPLGSIQNEECKIDGISQSWAVISGAGEFEKSKIAMESVENYLVDRENMIIKLLTPPFNNMVLEPGYIKSYIPGVRENGGQYTHGAIWSIIANAILKDGDRAGEYFRIINPIEHARTKENAQRYKVEPYVVAADVYSTPNLLGRGGWTWYTGSSSWLYVSGLKYILGFNKCGNKLKIEPCIPKEWDKYEIEYKYIETIYNIKVNNPLHVNGKVKSISFDNTFLSKNEIILSDDKKMHTIEVELG